MEDTDQPTTTPQNIDDHAEQSTKPRHRPLKFSTPGELQEAIDAYFDMCDPHKEELLVEGGVNKRGETIWTKREVMTSQVPYTISGLANALKVSRQTLLNYADREDFFDSIDAAKSRCEEYAERQLYGPYANGAKFNLINNYRGKHQDWAEKHEVSGPNGAPVLMPIAIDSDILNRNQGSEAPTPSPEANSSE